MSRSPVVVVGAGPVGLTAALLLARRGLPVVVLERQSAPYGQPRAVHLDDEALRVLADAGVAEEFLRVSRPIRGLRLLDGRHRVLAEFARSSSSGLHGWPQGSMFSQPDLEELLLAAVRREPLVELHTGCELVELTPDGVVARDRASGARSRLRAAAVLGCDGANSTVRALIGARMRDLGRPDRWLVADLRSADPLPLWPGVHQVCDPHRAATAMPVSGDRYRVEFRLRPGETRDDLAARLPALLAPWGAADAEVVRVAEYTYRAQVADRWRSGRVLIAGDAAHLTPPFIGQGLGLGLRDVHQLAWKLAAVLAGTAPERLLDTHQAERAPHARAMVRLALLLGRLMTGGGGAAALLRHVVLAAVGLLVFPLVIISNLVFQHFQSPLMTRVQALRAELSEIAHESFDGAMVVKSLGREPEETERFAAKARTLRDTSIRAGAVRAVFDPVLEALPSLGVLGVLLVGVARVQSGATAPGDVVNVAYLLMVVAFPIRSIGWLLGEFPRSVVGFRRVRAVLRERGHMEFGDAALAPSGSGARLEVRHVGFGYDADGPDGPVPGERVLEDVSFTVAAGRTVALVGATASGKSTLATLLFRLVDPDTGAILVDGCDLRSLEAGDLARHAALVPQQAFLFDDTVRGNVTLGADVSDEAVWQALRTAQADGFVAALPDGLDARLGERGTTLSGGQRQRLSLARALVRRPRLLVMDDATSAVDPEVEARILAALRAESAGATVLVVAYRKATIGLADEVVFLADGRVVDQGRHAELLRRNSAYAELVNAYESEAWPQPGSESGSEAAAEVGTR